MKNSSNKNKTIFEKSLLSATVVLLLAAATFVFAFTDEECAEKYSFVNKRFACFEKHVVDKKDYRELRGRLIDYINEERAAGNVEIVSVFFRDLEAGPTMGIDERIDYAPASLLKLPTALVLMRLYEEGEIDLLSKNYSFTEGSRAAQVKRAGHEIKAGKLYSLEELITHSLSQSDNVANQLLLDHIDSIDNGRNLLSEIYRDLGIIDVSDSVSPAVNTKGYSTIFRMLYNSSFLKPESSEKLLEIMSHSIAAGGLRAGVPDDIKISHKYGERVIAPDDHQLHDCGIIFYPRNPYLLCVMTRGRDMFTLQEIITEISRRVYEEFDSRRLEE